MLGVVGASVGTVGAAMLTVGLKRVAAGRFEPTKDAPYLLCTLAQMRQLATLLGYEREDESKDTRAARHKTIEEHRKRLCGPFDEQGHARPERVTLDDFQKGLDEVCAKEAQVCDRKKEEDVMQARFTKGPDDETEVEAAIRTMQDIPDNSPPINPTTASPSGPEPADLHQRHLVSSSAAGSGAGAGAGAGAGLFVNPTAARDVRSSESLPRRPSGTAEEIDAAASEARKSFARTRSGSFVDEDRQGITLEWRAFIVGKANATQYDRYGRIIWNSYGHSQLGGKDTREASTEYALTLLDLVYISYASVMPSLLAHDALHDIERDRKKGLVEALNKYLNPILTQRPLPDVVTMEPGAAKEKGTPGLFLHPVKPETDAFAIKHPKYATIIRFLCALSGTDNYKKMEATKSALKQPEGGFGEPKCSDRADIEAKWAGHLNTFAGVAAIAGALYSTTFGIPALLVRPTTVACEALTAQAVEEDKVDTDTVQGKIEGKVGAAQDAAKSWAGRWRDRLCWGCLTSQQVEVLDPDWRSRWPTEAQLAAFNIPPGGISERLEAVEKVVAAACREEKAQHAMLEAASAIGIDLGAKPEDSHESCTLGQEPTQKKPLPFPPTPDQPKQTFVTPFADVESSLEKAQPSLERELATKKID